MAGLSIAAALALSLSLASNGVNEAALQSASPHYWKVNLPYESALTVAMDELQSNAKLELLNSAGSVVSFNGKNQVSDNPGTASEVLSPTLNPLSTGGLPKGIYYVKVSLPSGATDTPYHLKAAVQQPADRV